jgi:RNA recognition motif-containing protein
LPERFGRRQGYAFITFENEEDVGKAVADVNGKELLGREMRVQKATSGGPYTTENGDTEGKSATEGKKSRPKPRSRVSAPNSTIFYNRLIFRNYVEHRAKGQARNTQTLQNRLRTSLLPEISSLVDVIKGKLETLEKMAKLTVIPRSLRNESRGKVLLKMALLAQPRSTSPIFPSNTQMTRYQQPYLFVIGAYYLVERVVCSLSSHLGVHCSSADS